MTTDDLIQAVRDYVSLPAWDEGADARLIRLLNYEQRLTLQKLLQSARKQYRTATLDVTVVANRLSYQIPPRAITSGLTMLQGIDSSGGAWILWELPQGEVMWPASFVAPGGQWFLEGNNLCFYQTPPYTTLRFWYPRRLSELVAISASSTDYDTITTINTSTNLVSFTTSLTGNSFDLVQSGGQFDLLAADVTTTGSGATRTFPSLPYNLAVGDYICKPGKTPVCMAPLELQAVLSLRVAQKTVTAKGDPQAQVIAGDLQEAMRLAATLLEPRPERVRAMRNPSAPGMSFNSLGRWWRG